MSLALGHVRAVTIGATLAFFLGACTAPTQSEPTGAQGAADEDFGLAQNTDWTIDRGATQKVRVVAYGDSIFAGYQGGLQKVGRRAAPYVAAELLALRWQANVEVVRRAQTGGVAADVLTAMTNDKSFMQDPSTRAVYFEMCGNDYLQARQAFASATGTCDTAKLDAALATCITNVDKAMTLVNATATTATTKGVANLYYPGFDKDVAAARCTDASGQHPKIQDVLLPYMARSNYRTCSVARQRGFGCADTFAEFMAADVDTNDDGLVDSDALRLDPSGAETEAAYVTRITQTLRATLRDGHHHGLPPGAAAGDAADYIYSDDIHPTVYLGMVNVGSTGTAPPDFTDAQLGSGRNPMWNLYGHERLGAALAAFAPAAAE